MKLNIDHKETLCIALDLRKVICPDVLNGAVMVVTRDNKFFKLRVQLSVSNILIPTINAMTGQDNLS